MSSVAVASWPLGVSTPTPETRDTLDLLWPSPLLKLIDPIAKRNNAALKKLLLGLAQTTLGVRKTNLGGWQSEVDLFEREDAAVSLLRTRTYHAVFRYLQAMAPAGSRAKFEVSIGSAWANINNRSHSNSPHLHPGVHLAGVYYVDDGGSRDGGVRLVDPRPQASMVPAHAKWMRGVGEHIRVQARPGLFVIFPAWLQHYVVAHEGGRPRISVSFNVRLTFPPDEDDGRQEHGGTSGTADSAGEPAVASGTDRSADEQPARLSFTVPAHHQRDFLDAAVARDMVVN